MEVCPPLLDQFMKQNFPNYKIVVEKGQRVFRPKDESFDFDPAYDDVKKHEVFVSNLPNDLFEDELLPFLCRIGPVFVVRSIMNFSGSTKGMAYVIFASVESAYDAVEMLDGEYIRYRGNGNHRKVRVSFSVNNNRLLLHDLAVPHDISVEEVKQELDRELNGVTAVKLYHLNGCINAMVSFESHQAASEARRILIPKGSPVLIFGRKPLVEWAKPKDFKSLFVRFNCSFINQEMVGNFFESKFSSLEMAIKVINVTIQGKNAFVKFQNFSQANYVLKKSKGMPRSEFFAKEPYIQIESISWPTRK